MLRTVLPSRKVPCRGFLCYILCFPSTKVPCRTFSCDILCSPRPMCRVGDSHVTYSAPLGKGAVQEVLM